MPRKIGYAHFSPAQKAALRKAQLESARKRRKHHSDTRPVRRQKHAEDASARHRKRRNIALGAAAVGAAAAVGVVGYQQNKKTNEFLNQPAFDPNYKSNNYAFNSPATGYQKLGTQAEIEALVAAAGDVTKAAESIEQWDARCELYGDQFVIGEHSDLHNRPEIFPTIPQQTVVESMQREQVSPSHKLEQDVQIDPTTGERFVVLYHRTGGGKDLNGASAKASIIQNQTMNPLNRDEKRSYALNPGVKPILDMAMMNNYTWWSNKLNDSNTRGAFGEDVVQIKVPERLLKNSVSEVSQGTLSPGEVWGAIPKDILNAMLLKDTKIEDVPPEMITPKPKRKFTAPR